MPLYFFWIACICGWISCMPRDALICLTNSGIRMIRITITRPTMENAHVQPEAGSMPMPDSRLCQPTMIQATAYSSG